MPPGAALPPANAPRSRAGWLLAVPLALAAAAYARVLDARFAFDDGSSIVGNPAARDLARCLRELLPQLLHGGRPTTDLTFALNHAVAGLEPWNFHVTNLAIHLSVAALAFAFTRTVLLLAGSERPEAMAVATAGLFALHPLQSEVVSYLTQRAEALASGLYLATLLLLLAAERRGPTLRGAAAYLAALAAFVLGLGAKPIAVTLPLAYLLLTWIVPSEDARRTLASWPRRLLLALPVAVLGACFAFATLHAADGSLHAGFGVPGLPARHYFLTQWRAIATYLRLLAWPAGQSVDWGFPLSTALDPATVGSGLILLALAAGAAALGRSGGRRMDALGAARRVSAFGLLWFFLLLAPTSSVVPLADTLVEHRVYLASWGIFVAAVALGERLLARVPGRRGLVVAAALVGLAWAALAACTYRRNAVWEDPVALWRDAVAKAPRYWRGHLQLGYALWNRGRWDEAIREYRLSVEQPADRPDREAELLADLGAMLIYAGRLDEASAVLRRAVEIRPRHAGALVNLAVARLKLSDLAGAEEYAIRALERQPGLGRALEVVGEVKLYRGDAGAALPYFTGALRVQPEDGAALFYLGVANEQLGGRAEACAAWRRLLRTPGAAPAARDEAMKRTARAGCPGP